jgi:uncharacterized repeat protein (TIGR01451 family)
MRKNHLALTLALSISLILIALTLATPAPAVAQGGGDLTLVSVATDGSPGDYASFNPSISADGRYVAFASGATNLVASDANGATRDIFVRDLQTGTTVVVSVASDGTQGNGGSYDPSISADGRYVAFESVATNLISPGTNDDYEIYVHDRDADEDGIFDEAGEIETVRVSIDDDGNRGNSHSFDPSISGDGRLVAFNSNATNLVDNDISGQTDVFVHDRDADDDGTFDEAGAISTLRVSVSSGGTAGNGYSGTPSMAAGGRYVAFESAASNLVGGDTNGARDIFVHDLETGTTTRVSVDTGGGQGDDHSYMPTISPDGRYVAFASAASDLIDDDANAVDDVFLHDRDPDEDDAFDEAGEIETTRVSIPNCGGEAEGDLIEERPALSSDGRYVAFQTSAANLIHGDAGYDADTFVRDRTLGQTAFVSVVPGVEGAGGTCHVDMSDDGQIVAFQTGSCINGGQIYVRDRGDLLPADAPTDLLHVSTGGSDTAGCGESSSPCRTVQHAVDQAACGATIKVATGIYTGTHTWIGATETTTQVVYLSQPVTITGGFSPPDWTTADPTLTPTTLDAESLGQVIVVGSAPTVTLEGLRIVNGYSSDDGGGVGNRDDPCHLTIRSCDIAYNATEDDGAGVYLNMGTLILEDARIEGNTAGSDGGGVYTREAVVTMTQNLFQENVADTGSGGGSGGGAWLYQTPAYIADSTFRDNVAGDVGGGVYVGLGGNLTLERNEFLYNTATDYAGGLHAGLDVGDVHTITHNLFQGNVANPSGSGEGGGAYLTSREGAQLAFRHNEVVGNYACTGPTGANGGLGGGVFVIGPARIADNLFEGNWANSAAPEGGFYFSGYGGGLYVKGPGIWVERNRILDNVAARNAGINYTSEAFGGGIRVGTTLNTVVTMTNNILAGNRHCADCGYLYGFYRGGGAIAVGGYTTPAHTRLHLYHNTIADNQSPAIFNESAAITMSHTILAGHDVDLRAILDSSGLPDSLPPTNSADQTLWWPARSTMIESGSWTHTDDATGDPDFVRPAQDDYHLGSNSQAIDQGPGGGVGDDVDGHPRPIGSGYDLGADEYTGVDLSPSSKRVTPREAMAGQVVTFTITIQNDGQEDATGATLSDAIPAHTVYVPGSAQATSGTITDTNGISWSGTILAGGTVTVTLRVTVTEEVVIENTAVITDPYGTTHPVTTWVNEERIYIPLVLRSS